MKVSLLIKTNVADFHCWKKLPTHYYLNPEKYRIHCYAIRLGSLKYVPAYTVCVQYGFINVVGSDYSTEYVAFGAVVRQDFADQNRSLE